MRCPALLSTLLVASVAALAPRGPVGLRVQDPGKPASYHDLVPSYPAAEAGVESTRPHPRFPHRPGRKCTGFIALGDSYSAGIGTGVNGTEHPCRRGLHAHPVLIRQDLMSSLDDDDDESTTFQFLSCTGSTVQDLLLNSDPSQIAGVNETDKADFALLSVGGNDLGFFDIMNSCVFRFYSFYSGTCEDALRKSEEAIASPDFENYLRLAIMEILDRVHWEKRPMFTITVTGYARFFNADTEACDESSFGVWWSGPKLKRELRRKMNEMVVAVNDKIRRSVDSINAGFTRTKVLFVDYDALFEGHRFCEPGIIEPDYARNETWFFLVGGTDNADDFNEPPPRQISTLQGEEEQLPLIDPETCMGPAVDSGDWGLMALCMMATAAHRDPSLRQTRRDGEVSEESMWYVPTYYGQTFHPRTKGQEAIRDQIYRRWEEALDE